MDAVDVDVEVAADAVDELYAEGVATDAGAAETVDADAVGAASAGEGAVDVAGEFAGKRVVTAAGEPLSGAA